MFFIASHARKIILFLSNVGKGDVEKYCDPTLKSSHNKNIQTIETKGKIPFTPTSNK